MELCVEIADGFLCCGSRLGAAARHSEPDLALEGPQVLLPFGGEDALAVLKDGSGASEKGGECFLGGFFAAGFRFGCCW